MEPIISLYYNCHPSSSNMEQIDMLFDPIYEDEKNYQEILVRNKIAEAFDEINIEASYQELFSSLWQTGMPCFDLKGLTANTNKERSILKYCEWKGMEIPCSQIFSKFPTDNGMCCSFNIKSAEDVFIQGTFSRLITNLQENDKNKSFDNNLFKKDLSSTGGTRSEPGISKGLTVILDAHTDIFSASSVDSNTQGFTGLVSSRGSFPQRILRSFEIKPGHNNLVALSGTIIESDVALMLIDPKDRNCSFEWENSFMKIYNNYTQTNCVFECNLFYAQDILQSRYPALTKCFPWYYQSSDISTVICDPWQATEMLQIMSDIPDRICNHCLPDCSSTIFKMRISTAPLRNCSLISMGNSSFCNMNNHKSVTPNMLDDIVLNDFTKRFGSLTYYMKKNFTSSHRKFGSSLQNGDIFESTNVGYDAFNKDIAKVQVYLSSATVIKYPEENPNNFHN